MTAIKSACRLMTAAAACLFIAAPIEAAETGGCGSFAWPVTVELEWMKSPDAEQVGAAADLATPPSKAIAVTLKPSAEVTYPVAPSGKPKSASGETFGAVINFAGVAKPGVYQVSLSGPGWIDVVQNGATLKSTSHSGKSDCEGLRKSVRFDIGPGPFTVELSSVPSSAIRFSIRNAE